MEYKGHEIVTIFIERDGQDQADHVIAFGPYFPPSGKTFISNHEAIKAIEEQVKAKDRR
jgi:hypothetical protein